MSIAASVSTVVALGYAAYQVRQARISASAGAAAMIFSNIRTRVNDVAAQNDPEGLYEATCDLLNELEISCAIYFDGQFGGNTGTIATKFIKDILASIEKHERLLACAARAVHKEDTFDCIRRFCGRHKQDWKPLKSPSVGHELPTLIDHTQSR